MTVEEVPYREGNQEEPPQEDSPEEAPVKAFVTGFLVLQLPDGKIETITELPDMGFERVASLKEIRDLAHVVYDDARTEITAKAGAMHFTRTMLNAAQAQQSKNIGMQMGDIKQQAARKKLEEKMRKG